MYVIRHIRVGLTMVLVCVFAVLSIAAQFSGAPWTLGTSESHMNGVRPISATDKLSSTAFVPPVSIRMTPAAVRLHLVPSIHAATKVTHPISLKKHTRPDVKAHHIVVHVQSGQSLWQFATRFHTTVSAIQHQNHLHGSVLQIGQVLIIPKEQQRYTTNKPPAKQLTYRVQSGDSLWRISETFGVSIDTLRTNNNVMGNLIRAGQVLDIGPLQASYHVTPASKALIAAAPKCLIPVYKAAGSKYGIPWTVLAAIHKEETDFDTRGNDVSYAGAIGPMQFMPDTFAIFGVPAPGHSTPNIHNVDDAIYSTAHMLHVEGFQADPYYAIFAYNHSSSYVHDILHMSAV